MEENNNIEEVQPTTESQAENVQEVPTNEAVTPVEQPVQQVVVPENNEPLPVVAPMPQKPKKSKKGLIITIIILVLLAVGGLTTWLIMSNNNSDSDEPDTEEKDEKKETKKSDKKIDFYYAKSTVGSKMYVTENSKSYESSKDNYKYSSTYECKSDDCEVLVDQTMTSYTIIFDNSKYYMYNFEDEKTTKININDKIDKLKIGSEYFFMYASPYHSYAIYDVKNNKLISEHDYNDYFDIIPYKDKEILVVYNSDYDFHYFDIKNNFKEIKKGEISYMDYIDYFKSVTDASPYTSHGYKLFEKCQLIRTENYKDGIINASKSDVKKYNSIFDYIISQDIVSVKMYYSLGSEKYAEKNYTVDEFKNLATNMKDAKISTIGGTGGAGNTTLVINYKKDGVDANITFIFYGANKFAVINSNDIAISLILDSSNIKLNDDSAKFCNYAAYIYDYLKDDINSLQEQANQ